MTDIPEYTGGKTTYYMVDILSPTDPEADPYTAECQDIIEALGMNFNEGNAFKALWRRAAARLGKSKRGYTDGHYDAEKVAFYGQRLVEMERLAELANVPKCSDCGEAWDELHLCDGPSGEASSGPIVDLPAQSSKQATHRDGGGALFKRASTGRWMQWGLDSWFTFSADPRAVPTGLRQVALEPCCDKFPDCVHGAGADPL